MENKLKQKFLFKIFKGSKNKLIASTLLNICQPIFLLPIVLLVRQIIDDHIPQENIKSIIIVGVLIILLYTAINLIKVISNRITLSAVKTEILTLRKNLFKKLYDLPHLFIDNYNKTNLHTIIVQDINRLDFAFNITITSLLPSLLISISLLFILLYINIKLFILIIIIGPLIVFISKKGGKKIAEKTKTSHRYYAQITREIIGALKIFDLTIQRSAVNQELKKQYRSLESFRNASYKHALVISIYQSLQNLVIAMSGVFILVIGGIAVVSNKITFGDLISFYVAIGMLKANLSGITRSLPIAIEGYESLSTIYDIYNSNYMPVYNGTKRIELEGIIKFKSVDFSYPNRKIFSDINFEIIPDSITELCGPNGSGKTTIIKLIVGFYKPDSGNIYANNINFSELDFPFLRKQIGVLDQTPLIIPSTISENISYGFDNISIQDIHEAAKTVQIHEFIENLPDAYDTVIGDDGINLSGGEIQSIAFARAIIHKPKLLILDEPTNNLDKSKINLIIRNLRNLPFNPTILVISHNNKVSEIADISYIISDKTIKYIETER